MALPWWIIKDLNIDKSQKIGLALIFSVAIVCVAIDIVRTIEAVAQNQALYTIIEINLVVIISCLPTYRALLSIFQRRKSRRPSGSSAWRSLEEGGSWRREQHDSHRLKSMHVNGSRPGASLIHVTKAIDVSDERGDLTGLGTLEASDRRTRPQAASSVQAVAFS